MDSGLIEPVRPVDVGELLQNAETLCPFEVCAPQNEQQGTIEPFPSRRQGEANEAQAVVSHSLEHAVDSQHRAGVLHLPDFYQLRNMLDAQRDKILEQLQELQKVVVLQCRITGTNPLAQEMASVVLGKRVGKKFGDSLTPKALKCLYNVFSIKDTITKKEAREISALSGATVTQVREFFAGQRSRVRKVVHSSHVDQGSDDACVRMQSLQLDQSSALLGLHSRENILSSCPQEEAGSQCNHLVLLESFCGKPDGFSSKLYAVEKAEHLINLMHKEITFTGQSQLAQVIMQAHGAVLRCFMARGGLQQITRWLIQAAAEEQTSLIRLILKAITQLPLGSASPRHMSLLLQTVNKLRFYRAQDVASRARLLLSRWSKFCKSTQSGKLVPSSGLTRTSQPGQKRSRDCIHPSTIDDASKKKAKAGSIAVDSGKTSDMVSSSLTEDKTVPERQKPETVAEVNNTKKRLGGFLIQGDRAKEKRKVQLFEETRGAIRRRDGEVSKSFSFEAPSRPLSADDIKKAKRRAYLLNNTKTDKPSSSNLDGSMTLDLSTVPIQRGQKRVGGNLGHQEFSSRGVSVSSSCSSMEKGKLEPALKIEKNPKVLDMDVKASSSSTKAVHGSQIQNCGSSDAQMLPGIELSSLGFEMCPDENMMPSIHWTVPPRIATDSRWKVASGEDSKEIGSETKRLSTVLEATYPSPQCIPSNPAEPAERLCLFGDDTLVPEILLEAVDEESLERDVEPAEMRVGEADSQKSSTNTDVKVHADVSCYGTVGNSGAVVMEMVVTDAQLSRAQKDQTLPFLSVIAQGDGTRPVVKVNSSADALKSVGQFPSEIMLGSPLNQASIEVRKTEFPNADAREQGSVAPPFCQLVNMEVDRAFKDQTQVTPSPMINAGLAEPFQSPIVREDILSSTPRDVDCLRVITSSETNMEPLLLDQVINPSSGNNTSSVDLSEFSKETCMDMLNIVLQQLADNAKGSGADPELLSVFLKNPQLVYSLMSSQSESLDKGLTAAFAERDLGEIISSSTIGRLGNQLEELVGRNIGQVASSVKELANAGSYMSEVQQPSSRPSIAVAGPQSHPSLSPSIPRPLGVTDPAIQLQKSHIVVLDGSQFLKHPVADDENSSRSSEYDWTQPYDYPSGSMQKVTGSARQPVHSSLNLNRSTSNSAYPQTPAGYTQMYLSRAGRSQSSQLPIDQWAQSSVPIYGGGGHGQLGSSIMHAEMQEREINRRNGFCVADAHTTRLLPNFQVRGAGISDGLLPVPDVAPSNVRTYPSKMMHESHSLHGGTVPAFSPDVRVSPAPIGHQVPQYKPNGHYYYDQSFGPQSVSNSHTPYLSHGRGPSSTISSPIRSQGNPNMWRPPPSHSNRPRHVSRPGWREC